MDGEQQAASRVRKSVAGTGNGFRIPVVDDSPRPGFRRGDSEPGEDASGVLWLDEAPGSVQIVVDGCESGLHGRRGLFADLCHERGVGRPGVVGDHGQVWLFLGEGAREVAQGGFGTGVGLDRFGCDVGDFAGDVDNGAGAKPERRGSCLDEGDGREQVRLERSPPAPQVGFADVADWSGDSGVVDQSVEMTKAFFDGRGDAFGGAGFGYVSWELGDFGAASARIGGDLGQGVGVAGDEREPGSSRGQPAGGLGADSATCSCKQHSWWIGHGRTFSDRRVAGAGVGGRPMSARRAVAGADRVSGEVFTVPTVTGEVRSDALGMTLMHEHIFILAPELEQNYPEDWREQERVEDAVRKLRAAKNKGIDSIVDLTVLGLGRDIPLIHRVAERVDINIIVATGAYVTTALPLPFVFQDPKGPVGGREVLIELFQRDIYEGIAGTDVRAAVLKCASDAAGLTHDVERTLRATAQVHLATNLPIFTHTDAGDERRPGAAADLPGRGR